MNAGLVRGDEQAIALQRERDAELILFVGRAGAQLRLVHPDAADLAEQVHGARFLAGLRIVHGPYRDAAGGGVDGEGAAETVEGDLPALELRFEGPLLAVEAEHQGIGGPGADHEQVAVECERQPEEGHAGKRRRVERLARHPHASRADEQHGAAVGHARDAGRGVAHAQPIAIQRERVTEARPLEPGRHREHLAGIPALWLALEHDDVRDVVAGREPVPVDRDRGAEPLDGVQNPGLALTRGGGAERGGEENGAGRE